MESIFTKIYETNSCGNNNNIDYSGSSGMGSEIYFNKDTYVVAVKEFITNNNIKTVVDLGCGDFKCGPLIYDDLDITYTGYDTYKRIVEHHSKVHEYPKYSFLHLDFCNEKEKIVNADLCIIKDVLQHWSLNSIHTLLDYLVDNKKFKYILVCNDGHQNTDNADTSDGGYRSLSYKYFPLKKYNPVKIIEYISKEVSIIEPNKL